MSSAITTRQKIVVMVGHPERLTISQLAAVVALEAAGQVHPWSEAQLRQAFTDSRAQLWGVWEGRVLLGYAVMYRLPFDAELQAITVVPWARRRGVANALLTRMIGLAEQWNCERLLLEVRESNQPARKLYARAGFACDGRRKGYYRNEEGRGEDALLMSLQLSAGAV